MESPFVTHRNKVLGYYGTAFYLRRLVLAMWNGTGYPTGLSFLTGLDSDHAEAAFEMMRLWHWPTSVLPGTERNRQRPNVRTIWNPG